MSWTTPRTWASGDVVRANQLNTDIAENLRVADPRVDWIYVQTFLNGWTNYGSTYPPARYTKRAGIVYLSGLLKDGTIDQPMFSLPAGYRPSENLLFPSCANNGYARINVYSDGSVAIGVSNVFSSIECHYPVP